MQFKIRNILSGSATSGRVSVFEEATSPGVGPPLHKHAEQAEVFHVIKGRHKFVLDGSEMIAEPGACVHVPAGAAHTFVNIDEEEGLLHFELLPSGSSEEFFATLVNDAASIGDMEEFFRQHGLELLGPPLG